MLKLYRSVPEIRKHVAGTLSNQSYNVGGRMDVKLYVTRIMTVSMMAASRHERSKPFLVVHFVPSGHLLLRCMMVFVFSYIVL